MATESYDIPVLKNHLMYHAFITHCENDLGFAKDLLEKIEQHHFRCIFAKRDFDVGAAVVDNIASAIHRSRRTVLVISKTSLQSQWCKYEMLAAIDDTNRHNRISFIPVLRDDVSDDDLPHPLRFVTYIHTGRDSDFLHKLLKALAAPDEDWEDHIPVGNLVHGLAWNYYFGYLKFLLPGSQINKYTLSAADYMNGQICSKVLLLFPASCQCRLRRLDEDPSGRITYRGEIELLRDSAGVVGRVYKNTVYSVVSKEGREFFFVGEYVTCIRTMYEMEQSGIAGMKYDDTRLLSTKFLITIKSILDRDKNCTNMYRIIFYEDIQDNKTETLPDHIVKAIQEEMVSSGKNDLTSNDIVSTIHNSRETTLTPFSEARPTSDASIEGISNCDTNEPNTEDSTSQTTEHLVCAKTCNTDRDDVCDDHSSHLRQQTRDSRIGAEKDLHGQTRTLQVGNEVINIF
ncbi:stimulator of interferon genes protein-like [Ylistrum balloti]|uniref:stimulator of interferon genes protein-like n=1 Tax=Ylistrum balloti TaxID=509963 RepID=UPI002905C74E|nr:stimulator of interferon genes protein-like [Ylistrum balloti]